MLIKYFLLIFLFLFYLINCDESVGTDNSVDNISTTVTNTETVEISTISTISSTTEGSTTEAIESKSSNETESEEELAILLPDKKSASISKLPSLQNLIINSNEKLFPDRGDKQMSLNHIRTRVLSHLDVEAVYNCTPDSFLSILTLQSEFDNYFTCNQLVEIPQDNKLNATLRKYYKRNGEPVTTPVLTYNTTVHMIFNKGNHMFYTFGNITGGQCNGDRLVILNVSLAKKGSCRLRSGVQQILSDYALLNISGKCQSTCFGDVNITVNPGLRN